MRSLSLVTSTLQVSRQLAKDLRAIVCEAESQVALLTKQSPDATPAGPRTRTTTVIVVYATLSRFQSSKISGATRTNVLLRFQQLLSTFDGKPMFAVKPPLSGGFFLQIVTSLALRSLTLQDRFSVSRVVFPRSLPSLFLVRRVVRLAVVALPTRGHRVPRSLRRPRSRDGHPAMH